MAKKKQSGLHKEISTIFDGVPLPNDNGKVQSGTSTIDRSAGHIPPAWSNFRRSSYGSANEYSLPRQTRASYLEKSP